MRRRGNQKSMRRAREAAEWYVRLRDNGLGVNERQSYLRWLKRSPHNIAETLKLRRLVAWLYDAKIEADASNLERKSLDLREVGVPFQDGGRGIACRYRRIVSGLKRFFRR